MCGMMCGKLQVCIKYVPSVVTQNHSISSIKINGRNTVDGQTVNCAKVVAPVGYLKTLEPDYRLDGMRVLVATLPKNRLKLYILSVTSAISRLEVVISCIGSTTAVTTLLTMWHSYIRLATLNTEVIPRLKTLARGLAVLDNQDRRIAKFVV